MRVCTHGCDVSDLRVFVKGHCHAIWQFYKKLDGQDSCVRSKEGHTRCPCAGAGVPCSRDCRCKGCKNKKEGQELDGAESHVSCKCGVDKVKKIRSTLPVETVNERQSVAVCVIKHNAGQIACVGIVAIVTSHQIHVV